MSDNNYFIPYGKQWIDEDDIQAVTAVLRSDWLTQGPKIREFEVKLAETCGSKYAVAVSNGTAALHLACLAAGIGYDDEVITSPITFVASANCALYVGATPVFADINADSYNIDPAEIARKISLKTRALIPVHFAGLPCDMEAIHRIACANKLVVIEDACHALGAEYETGDRWVKVGACLHSDMVVFSFHAVKHITTGEGGAVLTNNSEYYEKLLLLRSHGITKDRDKFFNRSSNANSCAWPWYYEMQELGFNYRTTDIQSALGLSQLNKLDAFVNRRRTIADKYNEVFRDIPCVKIPLEDGTRKSALHLYVLQIDFKLLGKSRSEVMEELRSKGIGTQVHYIPVPFQPYYSNRFAFKEGAYPVAEKYYEKSLSLPLYPGMNDIDIERVINAVRECLNEK